VLQSFSILSSFPQTANFRVYGNYFPSIYTEVLLYSRDFFSGFVKILEFLNSKKLQKIITFKKLKYFQFLKILMSFWSQCSIQVIVLKYILLRLNFFNIIISIKRYMKITFKLFIVQYELVSLLLPIKFITLCFRILFV